MENFAKLGILVESRSLVTTEQRLEKFEKTSDRVTKATERTQKATDRNKRSQELAAKAANTNAKATERNAAASKRAEAATNRLSRAKRGLAQAAQNATAKIRGGLNSATTRMARNFALAAASVIGFNATLDTIVRFEDGMARVAGITRATDEELGALRDTAKQLGATTEFSASEVADGLGFLGMAGFEATESIAAMPAVLDLATAAQIGLGQAADISSNILSGFGIAAADASSAIDVMAATASSANTNIPQLGRAIAMVGPVAAAAGISLEEVSAAVGVLGDAGIQGTRAGTALRQSIAFLLKPSDDAAAALSELGLSAMDVNPQMNSLTDIFSKLKDAGLDTGQAMRIFGIEASAGALRLTNASGDLRSLTRELGDVEGRAGEMARTFRETLGGSLRNLRSAAEGLAISLGEAGLTTAITVLVDGLTGLLRTTSSVIDSMSEFAGSVEGVGTALTAVATILSVRLLGRFNVFQRGLSLIQTVAGATVRSVTALGGALRTVSFVLGGFAAGGVASTVSGLIAARAATTALTASVGLLGGAVRLAGGPWGLLATAVLTGAQAFGLFERSSVETEDQARRSADAINAINDALNIFNDDRSEEAAQNAINLARAYNTEAKEALAAAQAELELVRAKQKVQEQLFAENPLTADPDNGFNDAMSERVEQAAARVSAAQSEVEESGSRLKRTATDIMRSFDDVGGAAGQIGQNLDLDSVRQSMEALGQTTSGLGGDFEEAISGADSLERRVTGLAAVLQRPMEVRLRIAEQNALDQARQTASTLVTQFNNALSELSLDVPVRQAIGALELAEAEANDLRVAINAISTSTSPEQLATSIAEVATRFADAYGSAEKIPGPMRELLTQAINSAIEMAKIANEGNRAAGTIDSAAGAASRLRGRLQEALGAIQSIANTNISLDLDVAGLQAQNKALAEGADRFDALAQARVATERARLGGAIGSQVQEIRDAAEAELAEFEEGQNALVAAQRRNSELLDNLKTGSDSGGSSTVANLRSEYESLMSSIDPVFARTIELRDAEQTLTAAMKAGMISADQKASAIDKLKESYSELNSVGEQVRDMLASTFSSILTGASSAADAVRQLALRLADMAFTKGFEQLFDMGGGTSFLGNFFGGVLGWNAKGTDNWRGGLTVVGEQGPEIVDLPKGSKILSNQDSRNLVAQTGRPKAPGPLTRALTSAVPDAPKAAMIPARDQFRENVSRETLSPTINVSPNISFETPDIPTPVLSAPSFSGTEPVLDRFSPATETAKRKSPGAIQQTSEQPIEVKVAAAEQDAPVFNVKVASDTQDREPLEVKLSARDFPASTPLTLAPRSRDPQEPEPLTGQLRARREQSHMTRFDERESIEAISPNPPAMAQARIAPMKIEMPAIELPEQKVELKVEPKLYFDRDKIIGGYMRSSDGRRVTMTTVEEDGAQR